MAVVPRQTDCIDGSEETKDKENKKERRDKGQGVKGKRRRTRTRNERKQNYHLICLRALIQQ
jgi:hypothetical protein